jgi:hypothetical protein
MDASTTSETASGFEAPPPRRSRRRESLLIRGLTGAVLVAAFVIAAGSSRGGDGQGLKANPDAPASLTAAIGSLSDPGRCLRAIDAEVAVHDRLVSLRMTGWTITRDPGVRDATCVNPAIDTSVNHIVLVQTMRPEVRDALSAFAELSYRDCLTETQASHAVSSILAKFDETGWSLRTDGPVGGPLDELDAIAEHVKKGCWIYSGTGWTADGQRVYYIAGLP